MSESENNVTKPLADCITETLKLIEVRKIRNKNDFDIPTGFRSLDKSIYGWQPGDLIVIGGRPSMGKSSFMLSITYNLSTQYNIPVAVFSLEFDTETATARLLSIATRINSTKIQRGTLSTAEFDRLGGDIDKVAALPVYINDSALSLTAIEESCRSVVKEHNIRVIVIDYLQLIQNDYNHRITREAELANTMRTLKQLARELKVVILLSSQLSRAVENRGGDKRPMLSDLRESGSIEQDANQVWFIYRPEYYGIDQDENGESTIGRAEIIIAKNRRGPLDNVRLNFHGAYTLFTEPEDEGIQISFSSMRPDVF